VWEVEEAEAREGLGELVSRSLLLLEASGSIGCTTCCGPWRARRLATAEAARLIPRQSVRACGG